MTTTQSVGTFLHSVLVEASDDLFGTERAAMADEPDGVHRARVSVRRLRSVLAGYRGVLDAATADRLRVDYAEWGRELGVVRDIEVRAGIAAELLTRARIDDGTVHRRLVDEERIAYAQAHTRLVERAQGPKAASRAGMLRAFVAAPGFSDPDAAADRVVVRVLRDQERRVRRAVHRLDGTEEAYHAVRKAARRLRYVAEAGADGAFPLPGAADLARTGEILHDLLGAHRDALLVADRIAHQRAAAVRAGEPGDPYARVEALARADAADRLTELPETLRSLRQARSALG